jgi:4-hydroxy-tetrahydrodipicolinate synthase
MSELKKWAKEHMRGLENITIPSFTPDFSALDEEGIRHDVRQAIQHGFFSTICAAEVGLTFDEAKRFVEIVADEAKGKILVSTTLMFNSLEQNIEFARHAQKAGCHCALLGYPPTFFPKGDEEIYSVVKEICDAAPNLGIVLYAYHNPNFQRVHPTGFPLQLLEKLADIPNVVAMKIGSGDPLFIYECFERCGNKILVNHPHPGLAPILVSKYGEQWAGGILYEMFQSPDKPYAVDYFNLLLQGHPDEAMKLYRRMKPGMAILEQVTMMGTYHWSLFKFIQWCVGGNGGLTRKPVYKMFLSLMMGIKQAFTAMGITPPENEEEFFVGRANYAKMKRN